MNGRKTKKYSRNKNILVIGSLGYGKTRFYVKVNLMQIYSLYFVTDSKRINFLGTEKIIIRT